MTVPAWRWIAEDVVLAIHDAQLAEHGGLPGLRDLDLLRSALARPRNLVAYGDSPDAAALAAAYGWGIVRNHSFIDGNKRTAFVVATLFLVDHGFELIAPDEEAVRVMLALAAGDMGEAAFVDWLREAIRPNEP